jgi:protoporphyrinogen oxidase
VTVNPIRNNALGRPLRVGIVGGGPGGLFAAWHLERLASAPLAITIVEASDRLGGKVCTPTFASAPVRYEAGAAELYDYSPVDDDPLRMLVRSLGLPTVPLAGAAVYLQGRRIANLDDAAAVLGAGGCRGLLAFDAWARAAMSPREFYESGADHAAAAVPAGRFDATLTAACPLTVRPYLEAMIHSDLATEPATTTAGYGLQNYLMNDPAYMRLYRIAGGNEQLVAALASRLAARVRLGARATRVAGAPGGPITVSWAERGSWCEDAFDTVILALPIEPLARLDFDDASLRAAIARHVAHHDHPAHYLRITLLVDRPVTGVPGEDDFLMLDAFGGTCLYVESNRDPTATRGVLGLLLGGATAAEMAGWSDEALVAAAVEALPRCLGIGRRQVLEARVHRWVGAVSAAPGGWSPLPVDQRHRPSAAHPNLFVVGDYLFDSTLNGVLDSAQHVAGWVAANLAGRPLVSGDSLGALA